MRYVKARIEKEYRELAYRIYVSEGLRAVGHLKMGLLEFTDMVTDPKKVETRTAEEVISDIKQGLAKLNAK